MIFQGLNESQKKAVMTTEGPVMIIAGPGTGKTLTITRRIAYLIHKGVNTENILAVTFTNRAAGEMRERTKVFLGNDAEKIFIGTFHFLGLRIIQEIYSDSFVIYNRDDQASLLKELMKGSHFKVQQLNEKISKIKSLVQEAGNGVKEIYEKYQSALIKNSAFDFDDLILKPIELLGNSEILKRYRRKIRYIMVDEYQDINPAQYKLLKLLTDEISNICVIGDSDQAIYAFRGADVTNFFNFEKDFNNAKRIILQKNYRSTGFILNASSNLVKKNLKRIDKEITPVREKGIPLTAISVPDDRTEGEVIVREIEERIGGTSHHKLFKKGIRRKFSESSYGFSDFAVIFRTNAQAKALEESFKKSGIPYQVVGRQRLPERNEVMRVLKKKAADIEREFRYDELLKKILEEAGLIVYYENMDILMLQNLASRCQDMDPSDAINNFFNELSLLTPADTYNPRAEAVTLMTLHMAKGLEFRIVFITGVEEGLIPFTKEGANTDIEEERRLFYVGMTRAKDELFIIHARKRFLYGQRFIQSPSSFIGEIPEKIIEKKFINEKIEKQKRDGQIGLF